MTAPEKKPTEFGWFFMEKMRAAGLSQSELKRRSTVPQSTISRYIFGEGRRDPDILRLLAPHIDVDPEALVALSSDNGDIAAALAAIASVHIELAPLAARINRLLGKGSTLPEAEQRDLERIIGGLVGQAEQSANEQRKRSENRTG